jgi:hypothetical protein
VSALTEEEIRAELARAWHRPYPNRVTPEFQWDLGFNDGFMGMGTAPWDLDDMRDSEIEDLDSLVDAALRPIRVECERRAIDALVGAMLEFTASHPDVPRAVLPKMLPDGSDAGER